VSPSFRTARWIGLASIFVLVAAAAFGAKLWHKAPKDFFLSLATDSGTAEATLPEAVRDQPTGTVGSFARHSGGGASPRLDALPPGGTAFASGTAGAVDRRAGGGKGWTPWGSHWARRGLNGSGGSSGSAALGGLWHSMSPFGGHGGGGAADTPVAVTARAEPKPKAAAAAKPAPSAKPAPKPSSPSTPAPAPPAIAAPSTTASAVPSSGSTASSGGLGEHETPLADVGSSPGSGLGPVGGGGSGPGGASAPSDVSANPEPGTIALVGTGLLGLIGAFRRRRRV
jgi:hypothetical protein